MTGDCGDEGQDRLARVVYDYCILLSRDVGGVPTDYLHL